MGSQVYHTEATGPLIQRDGEGGDEADAVSRLKVTQVIKVCESTEPREGLRTRRKSRGRCVSQRGLAWIRQGEPYL